MSVIYVPWEPPDRFKTALPPNLVLLLLDRYFTKGQRILDPFAGSRTIEMIASKLGIEVVSTDILWGIDCRSLPFKDCEFDGILTHPPYYKAVKFSEDPRDLSNATSYDEFLYGMHLCMKEMARVVKPKSFIVIIIGDYRSRGAFIPVHADVIKLAENIGLKIVEILVWARVGFKVNYWKKWSMSHDYVLAFVKP